MAMERRQQQSIVALHTHVYEKCSRQCWSAEQAHIRGRKNVIESYHDQMLRKEKVFAMEMPCPN